MADRPAIKLPVWVRHCPACGGEHHGLPWESLPVPDGRLTESAVCPATGETIRFRLLRLEPVPDDVLKISPEFIELWNASFRAMGNQS